MLLINTVTKLDLGVKDENQARNIYIDMNAWYQDYPNGTISIWHKRAGDQTKYAANGVTFDRETGILKWTPDAYDTYYIGRGLAEIRLTENSVIKKTKDILTDVEKSLILPSGQYLAAGWQNYLNQIEADKNTVMQAVGQIGDNVEKSEAWATGKKNGEDVPNTDPTYHNNSKYYAGLAADSADDASGFASDADVAADAAEDAQLAAEAARDKYPQIDSDTEKWKIWDPEQGQYVLTNHPSRGPQGVPGQGVPSGGTAGQILTKNSGTDYDAGWANAPDPTGKADKVSGATAGNLAGLDANGNLTDSGIAPSVISGKLDKENVYNGVDKTVAGYALDARTGNTLYTSISNARKTTAFQAVLSSGNWRLHSGEDAEIGDYIWLNGELGKATAAITGGSTNIVSGTNWTKEAASGALNELVKKDQGVGNAGKALGIGNDGMVTPVPFSGEDFTGATAGSAGVHGYVPAPAAGDQGKILMGDGSWSNDIPQRLANVENVYTDRDITIQTSDWTLSGGVYSYTWTDVLVTATCGLQFFYREGAEAAEIDDVTPTRVTGGVTFTTTDEPQGSLPMMIRIIHSTATEIVTLNADQIGTNAITGCDDVEEALGTLNSNLASYFKPTGRTAITFSNDTFTVIDSGWYMFDLVSPTSADVVSVQIEGYQVAYQNIAGRYSFVAPLKSGTIVKKTVSSGGAVNMWKMF